MQKILEKITFCWHRERTEEGIRIRNPLVRISGVLIWIHIKNITDLGHRFGIQFCIITDSCSCGLLDSYKDPEKLNVCGFVKLDTLALLFCFGFFLGVKEKI
jgi:hypothetical protein